MVPFYGVTLFANTISSLSRVITMLAPHKNLKVSFVLAIGSDQSKAFLQLS